MLKSNRNSSNTGNSTYIHLASFRLTVGRQNSKRGVPVVDAGLLYVVPVRSQGLAGVVLVTAVDVAAAACPTLYKLDVSHAQALNRQQKSSALELCNISNLSAILQHDHDPWSAKQAKNVDMNTPVQRAVFWLKH